MVRKYVLGGVLGVFMTPTWGSWEEGYSRGIGNPYLSIEETCAPSLQVRKPFPNNLESNLNKESQVPKNAVSIVQVVQEESLPFCWGYRVKVIVKGQVFEGNSFYSPALPAFSRWDGGPRTITQDYLIGERLWNDQGVSISLADKALWPQGTGIKTRYLVNLNAMERYRHKTSLRKEEQSPSPMLPILTKEFMKSLRKLTSLCSKHLQRELLNLVRCS